MFFVHKVNLAVKSKSKVIGIRHSKKLLKLQQDQKQQNTKSPSGSSKKK